MARPGITTLRELNERLFDLSEDLIRPKHPHAKPVGLRDVKVGVMVEGKFMSVEEITHTVMRDSEGDSHIVTISIGDNY